MSAVQTSGTTSAYWSTGDRAAFVCVLDAWIDSPSGRGQERTREALEPYFADHPSVQSTGGVQ